MPFDKNKSDNRISVVMASHNPIRRYFERALNSLFMQTVKDWELIIVDDHSEVPITPSYLPLAGDRRIKIVRLPARKGRSHARNVGLSHSRGPYVMFLDDDDWIHYRKFERHLEFLSRGFNFVYSDYLRYSEDKGFRKGKYNHRLKDLPKDPFLHLACNTNIMIHLPIFEKGLARNISFFEEASYAEDWAFYVLMFLHHGSMLKCCYIDEALNYVQVKNGHHLSHQSPSAHRSRSMVVMSLVQIADSYGMKRRKNILNGVWMYNSLSVLSIRDFLDRFSLKGLTYFSFCVYRFLEACLTAWRLNRSHTSR